MSVIPKKVTSSELQTDKQLHIKHTHKTNPTELKEESELSIQQFETSPTTYFNTCHSGIADGFGPMFCLPIDRYFPNGKHPVKLPSFCSLTPVIATVIMLLAIAVALLSYKVIFVGELSRPISLIFFAYLGYLLLGLCLNYIHQAMRILQDIEEHKEQHNTMIRNQGYFVFWIKCFHYSPLLKDEPPEDKMVVTHVAEVGYYPRVSVDQSTNIDSVYGHTPYVQLNYDRKFYFTNEESQECFKHVFNQFVKYNKGDSHQIYGHRFQIDGYEPVGAFTENKMSSFHSALFYIFTLMGLSLIYTLIAQRYISRYEVSIVKRLTL